MLENIFEQMGIGIGTTEEKENTHRVTVYFTNLVEIINFILA